MSKKDLALRIIRIILWLSLVGYAYYIYSNKLIITSNPDFNVYWVGFLVAFGIFVLVMGIVNICLPRMKTIQFLAWIFLILFGYYFFKDNPEKCVFVSDILRVLWVLLVVLGPFGLCVPNKCKKIEEEKKIEIIEV